MSSNSAPASNPNVNRLAMGDYPATVKDVRVIPFGDRPVIFTTLVTDDSKQITHAVRLHNPDALRIGLNELRLGFPNILGIIPDNIALIKAMNRGVIIGHKVLASVQPQVKQGITVKLDNGETAYNIRLYAIEKMTDETLDNALGSILAAAAKQEDDVLPSA